MLAARLCVAVDWTILHGIELCQFLEASSYKMGMTLPNIAASSLFLHALAQFVSMASVRLICSYLWLGFKDLQDLAILQGRDERREMVIGEDLRKIVDDARKSVQFASVKAKCAEAIATSVVLRYSSAELGTYARW